MLPAGIMRIIEFHNSINTPLAGVPPLDNPVVFLAGEFGCTYHWYPGFVSQSNLPGHEPSYWIYPFACGFPRNNPPFQAPVYRGKYILMPDWMIEAITGKTINKNKEKQLPLFEEGR